MKRLINHFTARPKTLFLIDSIGAFTTAISLFLIGRLFLPYFGMPQQILNYLSAIAVLFSIYSGACYVLLKKSPKGYLRVIGSANLIYCATTTCLLLKYHSLLTNLGTAYFLTEAAIICGLSILELKVAGTITESR